MRPVASDAVVATFRAQMQLMKGAESKTDEVSSWMSKVRDAQKDQAAKQKTIQNNAQSVCPGCSQLTVDVCTLNSDSPTRFLSKDAVRKGSMKPFTSKPSCHSLPNSRSRCHSRCQLLSTFYLPATTSRRVPDPQHLAGLTSSDRCSFGAGLL